MGTRRKQNEINSCIICQRITKSGLKFFPGGLILRARTTMRSPFHEFLEPQGLEDVCQTIFPMQKPSHFRLPVSLEFLSFHATSLSQYLQLAISIQQPHFPLRSE